MLSLEVTTLIITYSLWIFIQVLVYFLYISLEVLDDQRMQIRKNENSKKIYEARLLLDTVLVITDRAVVHSV